MPKRKEPAIVPAEIRMIQFEPGEFRPLFVRGSDIGKVVVGVSGKTLANWRSQGEGPPYTTVKGQVYYRFDEVEKFFGSNPVKTNNQGAS